MKKTVLTALAVAPFVSLPAFAASDADLAELRAQLRQLKESYEQRIATLEQKLAQTQQTAARAEESASRAATAPAPRTGAGAFNPEISLILSGNYTNLSKTPAERRLQGFVPGGGEASPEKRSFHLGESELAISANVDHLFRGNMRLAVTPDNKVELEEASIQTLGLGNGFNVKAGRFLSGIGYQNERHPHEWDFSGAPLPYQAFFGNALGMDGVQGRWLAPTPFFLEFGAEAARARSFPAADEDRNKNGTMSGALFAHVGDDIGFSQSWRAGVSYFRTSPEGRSFEDPLVTDGSGDKLKNNFAGRSHTWVIDGLWKWAPNGDASRTYLKLQGEYFRRSEDGSLTYDVNNTLLGTQTGNYRSRQSGYYAQAVWQFMPRWRVGYRYDRLDAGTTSLALIDSGAIAWSNVPVLASYKPQRHTLMTDWSPSEFSRIRLQFAQDKTRPNATDNQIWLQYVMSLGAHGAHKF